MEIRKLTANDKEQAETLWALAFPEDTEAFRRFYFTYEFPADTYYGIFEAGSLVCMAGMLPHNLQYFGKSVPAHMLRGVATHPEKTGQGLASTLMKYIMQQAYIEKWPFLSLKTFIHPFYERFGFATCTYVSDKPITAQPNERMCVKKITAYESLGEQEFSDILSLYENYIREQNFYLVRNERLMKNKLYELLFVSGGLLYLVYEAQRLVGYCMAYAHETYIYGEECVFLKEEVLQHLAADIEINAHCSFVQRKENKGEAADAMVRVVHAKTLLSMMHYRQERTIISLQDAFFKKNQGNWCVEKNSSGIIVKKAENETADISLSAGELAAVLFGHFPPHLEAQAKMFFVERGTGIFEQY